MMISLQKWLKKIDTLPENPELELIEGRDGKLTVKVGRVFLHSRYNPEQEAQRLVESADLDPKRPVLVAGLGLGYHVIALLQKGFEVAVIDPDPAVLKLAIQGPVKDAEFLVAAGSLDSFENDTTFQQFVHKMPQVLVHPPTARIYPEFADGISALLSKASLGKERLNIAVVGPLYGGSLPITHYLTRAFEKLGHNTFQVDNHQAWDLYKTATDSLKSEAASGQLGQMLSNFLSEWTYARVVEFNPDICIVIAQAPVSPQFPLRLAKRGIVSAFWYMENWRHLPYWKDIAPHYDYFFHIQPGEFEDKLTEIGCRHHAFVQTGCDPELHRPVSLAAEEKEEFTCDLSFAGAGYYNRLQFFKGLTNYDFKIWGVNWAERELERHVVGGERRFDSEDFMRIIAGSKINFNLHSSTTHDGVDPKCDALNPRIFEIAAAGGFQLCDPCIGLERHFDLENEIPVYHDLAEARKLIEYYLAHPEERKAIAERARKRALEEHTYEHRARQMLDLILARHGTRILKKGIRVQRTVGEMLERIDPDSELHAWLETLPPDTPFLYDPMKDAIEPGMTKTLSYPEQVFFYMSEVREFAEAMIKEQR